MKSQLDKNVLTLAENLMELKAGQIMNIATSPEENCGEEYAAMLIYAFGASAIYINARNGGGRPFIRDISVYYEGKTTRELAGELDEFLINGSFSGTYSLDYFLEEKPVMTPVGESEPRLRRKRIKGELLEIWKKEYPDQGTHLIESYTWDEDVVEMAKIQCKRPASMVKVKRILDLLQNGAEFPPIVCLNGEAIDGIHRYWAHKQAGSSVIRIYYNI